MPLKRLVRPRQENAAGAPKKGVAEPGEEAAARQAVRDLDALPQFFESVAVLDHEHPTHPRPPSTAAKPIEIDDHALTREFQPPRSTRRVHIIDAFLRSEDHTPELQSLMRTSYAVFCLKKQKR